MASRLLRFPAAVARAPAVDAWMRARGDQLGAIARRWFEAMRACGADVRELLHDGHPTACVGDAAFAYVNAFRSHVNVGFFRGAELPDPAGLLEGSGRFMRHVKLGAGREADEAALGTLVRVAYVDMKRRVEAEHAAAGRAARDLPVRDADGEADRNGPPGAPAIVQLLHAHGVLLASAKGPVPNVADTVAGEAIRGSWWGHAQGKRIFAALRELEDSDDVLTCRVVAGKRSFVHRRLWPALVRCAERFPADWLAWTREEHTASGRHVRNDMPFPEWVPADVLRAAETMTEDEALRALGDWAR